MGDQRQVKLPRRGKNLVTERKVPDNRLRAFVLEIVNAAGDRVDGSTDYFFRRYEEFFPTKDADVEVAIPVFSRRLTTPEQVRKEVPQIYYRTIIGELQDGLRAIWNSEDDQTAELRLFNLQLRLHRVIGITDDIDKNLQPPPPDAPIFQAIEWVRRNLFMLRICRNAESHTAATTDSQQVAGKLKADWCRTPFFVADDKSQRRFCSEACAQVAQKKHKLRYWHERHGRKRARGNGQAESEQNTGKLLQGSLPAETSTLMRGRIKKRRLLPSDAKVEHRLKRFIQDIANETGENTRFIFSSYAKFLPATSRAKDAVAFLPRIRDRLREPVVSWDEQKVRRAIVEELQDRLRMIWGAEDEPTARWRLLILRFDLWPSPRHARNHETNPDSTNQEALPLDEPIQQALHCLERNLHMLRRCGNPKCKTPFFIADKGTHRYCSVSCSSGAQKEYKTDWWREKGARWRQARRRQRQKSKKNTRGAR